MVIVLVAPFSAQAAQITNRKLTLGSSAPTVSTTYTFNFDLPSTTPVQSFQAQICTNASGACSIPAGFSNSSATIGTVTGLPGTWTVNNATAGSLRASTTTASSPTNSITIVFGSVVNPSTANATFYARLTSFSDTAWTTAIDAGTVAASTATQIQLSGVMDESLVFCAGTSITGQDCGTIAGSTVNFGTFSSTATRTGTSVMAASTNGQSGYSITVNGATLTSGSNTITALATQTASTTGIEQFGLNLRANTAPAVGVEPSGAGIGTYAANYGTTNQYRFVTGDSVASSASATNANAFTASYIVNVGGVTESGTYTANMTYICTVTF